MKKSAAYQPEQSKQVLPSAFALFRPSWQGVRLNLVTILELTLLPMLVNAAVFLLLRRPGEASFMDIYVLKPDQLNLGVGYFASLAATGLMTLLLAPAVTLIYLQSVKGKKIGLWAAFKTSLSFWWRYIGLTIVMGLAILGGFILLVIPGLFILQRYFLAGYFMVDQNLGIKASLKASWQATKQYSGSVWSLLAVLLLISLLSSLAGSSYLAEILGEIILVVYACAPATRYLQIKTALKN